MFRVYRENRVFNKQCEDSAPFGRYSILGIAVDCSMLHTCCKPNGIYTTPVPPHSVQKIFSTLMHSHKQYSLIHMLLSRLDGGP